jgi:3-oxoacyl-[acyl-carrier-protein] synthase II
LANSVGVGRRVVVTGLGAVTPLGLDVPSSWKGAVEGRSGAKKITHFDASEFSVRFGSFVEGFDPTPYLDPKDIRKYDTFILYAFAAASQAITDAKLAINAETDHRIGVLIGSGIGGLPHIEKNYVAYLEGGSRRISPNFIPCAITNMAAGLVSIKYGLKGPSYSIVSACATGTHSIGDAARMISYGDADVMVAGGTEMAITPLGVGGFAQARALSKRNDDPERASRPWDKDRDGFVLGDGAGVLVLEEYEHAKARGANIYAELAGYGMSSDAYHATLPDDSGTGGMRSMQHALKDAKLNPEGIDYLNAHGTSTLAGDVLEVLAIKRTFGDHAYKLAVSSTKSETGHLLGAAGAIEAIFSILAIRDQIAPPTINLDNPDEGCDLDFIPHIARKMKIDAVLSNSFGFGGTNATLIFKKI